MSRLLAQTIFTPTKYIGGVLPTQASGANQPAESIFGQTVQYIISAAFVISGLAFLVTFIMGAFTYLTSAGDEKQLDKAKKTMTNGVIGFVLIAITFIIVSILDGVFGTNILMFKFEGL